MIDHQPLWLHAINIRLGQPEYDQPAAGAHRWQWMAGEMGLRVDQRTNTWDVFAWSALRSVTLRSGKEPSAADLATTASLAGLCGPSAPGPASAVRFTPGVAPVPLQEAS